MSKIGAQAVVFSIIMVLSVATSYVGGAAAAATGDVKPEGPSDINSKGVDHNNNSLNSADIQKISRLYKKGKINYSSSLLYKYYVISGSEENIPDEYLSNKSAPPIRSATPIVKEIASNYSKISEKTKEKFSAIETRPGEGNASSDRGNPGPDDGFSNFPGIIAPQTYETQNFVIHYTNGNDGGDPADAPDLTDNDNDGVPDRVERIGRIYENALENYTSSELSYPGVSSDASEPDNGNNVNPNGKYDVFLGDLGTGLYGVTFPDNFPDQTTSTYIVHNVDFSWYSGTETEADRVTGAHEFFHAVQNDNYDQTEDNWWSEATAIWAEDVVYDDVNDYTSFVSGPTPAGNNWFDDPGVKMTDRSYNNAIFVKFLAQTYGDEIVRQVYEEMRNTDGLTAVDNALQDHHNTDLETAFQRFSVALYKNNLNNGDGDMTNDQFADGNLFPDVDTSDSTGFSGNEYTHQSSVSEYGVNYVSVSPSADSLFYEVDSPVSGVGSGYFWTGNLRRTSGTIIERRDAGNMSINKTQIQQNAENASQRNLLSSPPITANNTLVNANEYQEFVIMVSPLGNSGQTYDLEVDTVPSNNRYNIELDQNESATYAIPVNVYGTPNFGSTYEYNGLPYVGVWSSGSAQVSASFSGPSAAQLSTPSSVNTAEFDAPNARLLSVGSTYNLTINGPPEGPSRVNVTTNYLEGGLNSDQVFGLPSSSSIQFASNGDRVAGDPSNPGPVEFDVLIETADDPYVYSPFDAPDKSHFDVTVNGTTIPDSQIVLTEKRQNRYQIRFVPPTQQTAGQYNITVEFNDTKLGVERAVTANDTIQYTTGGGSAGAAATAIIIDDSGSMSGFTTPTKLDDAKDAGKQYVSQLGPSDYAAVIGFDFDAEVATPMIRATPSNKSRLNSGVDSLVGGGGTDIGAGLDAGFTELSNAPGSTQKAAVLLSDGRAPFPQSVVDKYNNSNIPVYTIALGSGADEADLKQIAAETGGQFYKEPTSSNLQDLYAQISQQVSGQSTISSKSGSVPAQSQTSNKLSVDSSTDSTTLRVSVGGSSPRTNATSALQSATVRLQYPNGTFVQLNSSTPTGTENSNITYSTVGDSVTYRINSPITGDWSYVIENTQSSGSLDYDAKATASTSTTVSVSTDTNTYVKGSTTTVTASVVNGSGGLSGATVVANITAPDGTHQITTLTEDSAGSYTTTLSAAQTGTYTAQINVTRGNVQREKSLTWDVVSQSAVAQVNRVNTTTPSVAQGGTASQTYNISQGTAGSPRAITTTGTITGEEFTYQVREIAASPPGTYDTDEFSEAALKAAQVYRNLSEADARSVFSAKGHVSGFVRVGELQTASGATISASQTSASKATVTVPQSGNETVTVTVDLPDTAAAGTYNGTVELIVSGTVISANISVTVTNVSESDYRSRIQSEVSPWQTASPSGKRAYEERIAGHLTDLYYNQSAVSRAQTQSDARAGTTFTYNSSGGPTGDVDLSSGDVYNHTVAVETNASDGPVEIVLYYPASSGIDVESVDATFAGSTVTVVNETTTVTINGKQMTRHRFVYRDPADVGTATFELTVGLETPERGQQVTLETGGVHAPSATTLTREQTSMNITHPLDEAVDTDNDGTIGNFEILDAINLWRTQNTVPDTQGKTIGNFEILNLINKWRDQTAV